MSIKTHNTYTYEDNNGNVFPLPFDPETDPLHVFISEDGKRAALGFLVQDPDASDPFEEFDEGDFYQFDSRRIHDCTRPELEEWKRIIRQNPGRVVSVDACGEGFKAGELMSAKDCRGGEDCRAARILEDMGGYYIAPEDAADPAQYAKGAIEQYTAWCEGDAYGVILWQYERDNDNAEWNDPRRDHEVWGYYGEDYAEEELKREFEEATHERI